MFYVEEILVWKIKKISVEKKDIQTIADRTKQNRWTRYT